MTACARQRKFVAARLRLPQRSDQFLPAGLSVVVSSGLPLLSWLSSGSLCGAGMHDRAVIMFAKSPSRLPCLHPDLNPAGRAKQLAYMV